MRSNSLILFTFFFVSMILVGCGGPSSPANTANGNANVPKANTNNPLAVATPTPEQTSNNAPTLTPVFKAYCSAMVKKDEAALRKVYSSDTIRYFEEQMRADKVKSLLKFLEDEKVSDQLCEVRNEQITGDSAIAEIRYDSVPNGIKIIFVKENGEWKLTNRYPALDSVKKSVTNSNKAK